MPPDHPVTDLVSRVYPALAVGDKAAMQELLAPDFVGRLAEGMPVGGGVHEGSQAMLDEGWWAIGREFAVRAEPDEFIPCADGRLLVLGRYRGRRRDTDTEVDASFAHLWTAREGRLIAVVQVTDTASWSSS